MAKKKKLVFVLNRPLTCIKSIVPVIPLFVFHS